MSAVDDQIDIGEAVEKMYSSINPMLTSISRKVGRQVTSDEVVKATLDRLDFKTRNPEAKFVAVLDSNGSPRFDDYHETLYRLSHGHTS